MDVLIAGARGSVAPSGPEFVRYGTATSCVALAHDGATPTLVLDAGTGLLGLSRHLADAPFHGTIILGHLHWDHTQGLPFFAAGRHVDSDVTVLVPTAEDPVEVLARAMGPPHFPIRPDELSGGWRFGPIGEGQWEIEGFSVTARVIPHLDSVTLGLRVSDGSSTLAYLSDHRPLTLGPGPEGLGAYHDAALALADGADVLIHDAQFTASELPDRSYLGHSAAEYAVGLGEAAGVGRVLLYHHDPSRTDDQLDALVEGLQNRAVPVTAAREDLQLQLR